MRVAIVQHAPVFLDLEGSLERLGGLLREAASNGASLITFGETWLPGYPAWIDVCPNAARWDDAEAKDAFARLRRNSLVVGSEQERSIRALVESLGVTLVLGINERVETGPGNHTLYNALLTYTPDGGLSNHHRKLVPTFTERMMWGPGDGQGLRTLAMAEGRLGSLICWEHWMPMARQTMHEAGEAVHIAVWPTAHERHLLASRHYAFEGRCFVLAAGQILGADALPMGLPDDLEASSLVLRGGSCVIGPDGELITDPVYDVETIVYADLDLSRIDREVMTLDVTGHYARPDVFTLAVDRSRRP